MISGLTEPIGIPYRPSFLIYTGYAFVIVLAFSLVLLYHTHTLHSVRVMVIGLYGTIKTNSVSAFLLYFVSKCRLSATLCFHTRYPYGTCTDAVRISVTRTCIHHTPWLWVTRFFMEFGTSIYTLFTQRTLHNICTMFRLPFLSYGKFGVIVLTFLFMIK